VSKAENILKTKGRKSGFSPPKAENIQKRSQLREAVETPKLHDNMTDEKDRNDRWPTAGKA
jgi:hypothetical protein